MHLLALLPALNVPARQSKHKVALVCGWYVPGAHAVHCVGGCEPCVPAGQAVHAELPAREANVPAAQFLQWLGELRSSLLPYLPAAQAVQTLEAVVSVNCPAVHSWQCDLSDDMGPLPYLPARHATHCVAPTLL